MQKEVLDCSAGQFELARPGAHPKQPLRAWDAADEYLIHFANQHYSALAPIIFNDQFGALGCAFNQKHASWLSDSYCAHAALILNQEINQLENHLTILKPHETCHVKHTLALIKLPKNTSYLEEQLNQCYKWGIKTLLIAGMMKHLPKNILQLLQKFGDTQRHPFVKKATIFELNLSNGIPSPYPKTNTFLGVKLSCYANVFGRDKLDPGAEFFLENLKYLPSKNNVADLCCGSGILGIKYGIEHTESNLDFYDESYEAILSSQISWKKNNLAKQAHFIWQDGLGNKPKQYDLILCNPPFHEGHTIGDHIAKRLFHQAKLALSGNGELVVVGNRHLGYHQTLKKYFKHVEQIASNAKFVLLKAHG